MFKYESGKLRATKRKPRESVGFQRDEMRKTIRQLDYLLAYTIDQDPAFRKASGRRLTNEGGQLYDGWCSTKTTRVSNKNCLKEDLIFGENPPREIMQNILDLEEAYGSKFSEYTRRSGKGRVKGR